MQAQRRSKEHSRSTSALSGLADEKSEVSQDADHHMSLYSNGFMASSIGNDPESPQYTVSCVILTCQCILPDTTGDVPDCASYVLSCMFLTPAGYQQTKTVEVQQRSSSVATQQTTVSSVPSHPSTTGVSNTQSFYTHCLRQHGKLKAYHYRT